MKVNITYIIKNNKGTLHTFETSEEALAKFDEIKKKESEVHEHIYVNINLIHQPFSVEGTICVHGDNTEGYHSYSLKTKMEEIK